MILVMISFITALSGYEAVCQDVPEKALRLIAQVARERGISLEELKKNPELRKKIFREIKENPELRGKVGRILEEAKDKKVRRSKPGYEVIVRNNLFRPLGYKKRKRGPSYRLLGTVISGDGRSKALIYDNNARKTYYVAKGEKIGEAVVERIEPKRVALRGKDGEINLRMDELGFLVSGKGGRGRAGKPGERKSSKEPEAPPPSPRFGPSSGPPPPPGFPPEDWADLPLEAKKKIVERMERMERRGRGGGLRPIPMPLRNAP